MYTASFLSISRAFGEKLWNNSLLVLGEAQLTGSSLFGLQTFRHSTKTAVFIQIILLQIFEKTLCCPLNNIGHSFSGESEI